MTARPLPLFASYKTDEDGNQFIVVHKEVLRILQKLDAENCHIASIKRLREIGFTFHAWASILKGATALMTAEDCLQSAMAALVLALVAIVTGVFFSNKAIVIISALGACCCAFAPVIMLFHVED